MIVFEPRRIAFLKVPGVWIIGLLGQLSYRGFCQRTLAETSRYRYLSSMACSPFMHLDCCKSRNNILFCEPSTAGMDVTWKGVAQLPLDLQRRVIGFFLLRKWRTMPPMLTFICALQTALRPIYLRTGGEARFSRLSMRLTPDGRLIPVNAPWVVLVQSNN